MDAAGGRFERGRIGDATATIDPMVGGVVVVLVVSPRSSTVNETSAGDTLSAVSMVNCETRSKILASKSSTVDRTEAES